MEFVITLEQDEDGVWVAECPAIPGCVSQGATQDEAVDSIREAIRLCLEVREELKLPLTGEVRRIHVALEAVVQREAQIDGLRRLAVLGPIDVSRIE